LLIHFSQTRTKLKEAFDIHLAAVVERAEKQIILAKHARRLLDYIDDTPVVPGDARQSYEHELEARGVLEDAENDLRNWRPSLEPMATADQEVPVHGNGAADHDSDGVNAGVESDSVINVVTTSTTVEKKQVNEPQASTPEAQPVPLAS